MSYHVTQDRRQGRDLLIKSLSYLAIVGWFIMFIAMIMIHKARPEMETILTRFFNISVRSYWNPKLITYIFYLMIFGFSFSIIGLVINSRRMKRKKDEYRFSLITLGIISLAGIIFFLFFIKC